MTVRHLMSMWLASTVVAMATGRPADARPGPCALAGLGWMAASWLNARDPGRAQEHWVLAPDGVLMGSSFEFPPGKRGYAEIMTVRDDGGAISMVLRHFDGALSKAWEQRDTPMVFKAATCDRTSVTFEGQGEHVGEHMTYSRDGDHLLIVADFLHGGKPDHEEWRMVAAP